ncbi:MAG: peptidoglycan-binding protein [Clostridia bacterium]|nr:peptidoglycan-binding protein [Clostridia bacterium]
MAYENLCMYCFEDMHGQTTCPHCGRDSRAAVPQVQMLPGSTVYHDRFLIGRALGQDAAGIVYAAFDTKKENRLRIREYLPRDCAERLNDGAVVPVAGMEDQFEAGIKKLRASVESMEDPRKRHFFFEENGTAYIAQRKSPAAAEAGAEQDDEEEEASGGGRRMLLFAGIAVAVLLVAAILLITVFNGAISTGRDITQSPTLDPGQVWIPATTPTATPYVAPTFAALVDPELSWMEYTYDGDVEQEYQQAQRASATPTPTPVPAATVSGSASKYRLINGNSSREDIRALQQRLAELGWLDSALITGKYDSATRQAVREFQSYVNQRYNPNEKLSVDGAAGPKTLQWLYEASATRPTPTPSPRVTPAADSQGVDENSPASQVRPVQEKLIALGLLPEGSADGSYGATTAAAVRRFQQRVNQLSDYDALEVTGRMDALSMAFLDYYAEEWTRLRQATALPTATPAPTPLPTPTPTTRPVESFDGVINANSTAQAIREVQQLLIDIGMMPAGSADGSYGTGTISAVADFQQWVNMQRDEQTLPVNGEVDQLTLAYLQYCVDHGMRPYGTPVPLMTATPTPTPTAAPTEAPVEAEPEPAEGNEEITVGADSDPDSIRYIQQMLSAVGAMDEGGVDGVYGSGTRRAVERFQQWVNSVQGEGALAVTGQVDNATRLALEYAFDHDLVLAQPTEAPTPVPTEVPTPVPTEVPTPVPTEAPTPEPTEVPTPVPTEVPPEEGPESGAISVGANSDPESIRYIQQMLSAIGAMDEIGVNGVYDDNTANAVHRFQLWVNTVQGEGTLPITGQVDDRTRQALEYAFDHELKFNQSPSEPGPEPMGIGAVGDVRVAFGDILAGEDEDVVTVPEGALSVRWNAEGDVEGYYVYVEDGTGQTIASRDGTAETSFNINTALMNPGEVYTLRLGVLPARGQRNDIVWRTVRFMLPVQITPTPEPQPTVGSVSAPYITIAGIPAGGDVITVEGDSFQIDWTAEGDVDSYYVRVTDASGNDVSSPQRTTQTGLSLRSDNMQAGTVYTLTVGVLPVNGSEPDMQISRAQFMRPVLETPTPEPTPQPVVANIGKPVITVGGSAYQRDGVPYMTDNAIILSWAADGDVKSYTIYVENQAGERQELGTTTDTSRTVSASSLPAGIYTIYVGALPQGGSADDMQWSSARFGIPAPEAETAQTAPEGDTGSGTPAFSGPVTVSSDSDTIQQLQMRLYSLGLLSTDGLQPGVLDAPTLQAVAEFQTRMNEQYGAGLPVIDPGDPNAIIDEVTLQALFAN